MRDTHSAPCLLRAWCGGVSVFCRWRTSRFAVNKSRKAVRYMRCIAQHACPRVARPSYLPIFRCYYIETRRKHTSHKTLTTLNNKTSDELLQYGDTPMKASAQCKPTPIPFPPYPIEPSSVRRRRSRWERRPPLVLAIAAAPPRRRTPTPTPMLSGTCARRRAALFTCLSRSTVPLPPRQCRWPPHTNCGHSGHLSSRHRLCSGHAHINEGSLVRRGRARAEAVV